MTPPWRARSDGLELFVRLTPKSARDRLEGVETLADGQNVLKCRVRAVPEDGKANAALIALVAKQLKTPASRIRLAAGATSRVKTLHLTGEAGLLAERLEKLVAEASPS
ncbi:hypothetical protein SAMN06265338_1067 [Rhodoblastus acidophilus]|uniref:UPF0235 protein SAMN06265338_1067 n=1 Tax=Rhodoblastus acidophilus TaxID=1074 RepID=A0A212RNU0_RHOAC|nr:DUF167 family protein [Rhodoblastus acidophilus]PPQ36683.1 hypothetical protein CKO16_16765 [Rhodoblastus acidophilus]RAI21520.1 hypothetical protein CH337_07540 [Rhodoblastus acidophilus]SNB74197.1 hypothetical protein SAMN06265338_1067 [Rhodoblastus acidophilus]